MKFKSMYRSWRMGESVLHRRYDKKVQICVIILSLASTVSVAQLSENWLLKGRTYQGRIIKHNPEIIFDPPALSSGYEIGLQYQTIGNRVWQGWQNYPKVGIAFSYFDLGDPEVLGRAYAARYNISRQLWRKDKWLAEFDFGGGLAWLDRPFNRMSNPTNNAIGSSANGFAQLNFSMSYYLHPKWSIFGGGGLTHYSNGAAQLPNLGINVISFMLGLSFHPQATPTEEYVQSGRSKAIDQPFGLRLEHTIGYREAQTNGGPRYPIRTYTLAGRYAFNQINRLWLGLTYDYNRAAYAFGMAVFAFDSERAAFWGASRLSVFVEDEFLFGNLGVAIQAGYYLGDFSYLVPNDFYFKISHRVYFDIWQRANLRGFAGITLKAHAAVAEHFALNLGITL